MGQLDNGSFNNKKADKLLVSNIFTLSNSILGIRTLSSVVSVFRMAEANITLFARQRALNTHTQ